MLARVLITACVALGITCIAGQASAATVRGTLTVGHSDDFARGRSVPLYMLRTDHGRRLELRLRGKSARALARRALRQPARYSGARVRIEGSRRTGYVTVARARVTRFARPRARTAATSLSPKKTLVILFNFHDRPSEPYTTQTAKQKVFTAPDSASEYYRELSRGQLYLTGKYDPSGDAVGWVTLSYDAVGCDVQSWAAEAKQLAALVLGLQGRNMTGYDQIIYGFPAFVGCASGGWAIGSSQLGEQVVTVLSTQVVAHELGHSFSGEDVINRHASGLRCTSAGQPVPISRSCMFLEYGDPFSVMGSGFPPRQHTNWYKKGLGLLTGSEHMVTGNGSWALQPSEPAVTPGGTPFTTRQAIRIPRTKRADGSPRDYYYLEYRRPFGTYFDSFDQQDPVVNGVTIRIVPAQQGIWNYSMPGVPEGTRNSLLVDTNPTDSPWWTNAPLGEGRTFTDSVAGVSITSDAVFGGVSPYAQVGVQFFPSTAPLVQVSSNKLSFTAKPGQVNTVAVAVKPDGSYLVSDQSQALTTGNGCEVTADPKAAICTGTINSINVDAGDRDDTASIASTAPAAVAGGAGNDTIIGGSASDELHGGEGNDTIVGGGGHDTMYGDDGEDRILDELWGAGGGNDTIYGGNGHDELWGGSGQDTIYSRDLVPGGWVYWSDAVDCGPNNVWFPDKAQINTSAYADVVSGCEQILP